ncbi:MAG TPA: transcriptional repressor [Ilumatobacteraceae bacterium]|nr:transcriptional repressor [Ilumatobacteraceae bacterium]
MAADSELHHGVAAKLLAVEQQYTANRRAVTSVLADADGPMTLPEILGADPSLAQSSAYRSLAVLVDAGVVRRLVHGSDHAHYELAEHLTEHHHHLVCDSCGTVVDVTLPERVESAMDRSFIDVAGKHGFVASRHNVDIYGMCAACR